MSPEPTPSRRVAIGHQLAGLAVSVVFAVSSDLTLAEFCWSVWLVGLYSAYVSAGRIALRLVRFREALLRERVPPLSGVSGRALLGISLVAATLLGGGLLYAFSLAYGFYGIMLSVWVQLPPEELFGRNGFINSDFWTPVAHLTRLYWPLVVGQLLSEASLLFSSVQQAQASRLARAAHPHDARVRARAAVRGAAVLRPARRRVRDAQHRHPAGDQEPVRRAQASNGRAIHTDCSVALGSTSAALVLRFCKHCAPNLLGETGSQASR